jgi:hypothetical protein
MAMVIYLDDFSCITTPTKPQAKIANTFIQLSMGAE